MIHFWHCLDVSACGVVFYKLLHDLACLEELLEDFGRRQDMFLRSSLFSRFHVICWMDLVNLMHDAFASSQETSSAELPK